MSESPKLSPDRPARKWLSLAALMAACGAVLPACEPAMAPHENVSIAREIEPILVRTDAIFHGIYEGRHYVVAGGCIARKIYRCGFEIGGKVTHVAIEEGDTVRPHQPLALLDVEYFQKRVEQAKIALEQAEADAAAIRTAGENIIPRTDRERAERNVTAAKVALSLAESDVRKATCTAPPTMESGVVERRHVDAGEVVAPGQPLFAIVDASVVKLEVRVPGRIVALLEENVTRVEVAFDDLPGVPCAFPAGDASGKALVTRVDLLADSAHQFRIEISIANPTGRIRPGMVGRATILLPALENVTALPASVATRIDDEYVVWLADTDAAVAEPWHIPASEAQLWGANLITPLSPPRPALIAEGFQDLFAGAPIRDK